MADGGKREMTTELVGLDDRPRPVSMRDRLLLGLKRSAPFSSLQRRIIFFNLIGLAVLTAGVLFLNQSRSSLIAQRLDALRTQGEIIALTLAETATVGITGVEGLGAPDPAEGVPAPGSVPQGAGAARQLDPVRATLVLDRLVRPTGLRARIYDPRLRIIADTRALSEGGEERPPTAPPASREQSLLMRWLERTADMVATLLGQTPEGFAEQAGEPLLGVSRDAAVAQAARGQIAQSVRVNPREELVVSVGVPIAREGEVMGVLLLSTVGGEINAIVQNERIVILQVFFVAAIVSVGLSILLAHTIAQPIRRLAAAAESEGSSAGRPLNPDRIEIPDMTRRADEIGELSAALIGMTEALYKRIEAIESFASDVAHEIKNPLTSMRSAVETMAYAKTPEQRQRLLDVIKMDVGRMDRLVTDISNASRLDAELVRERMAPFDLAQLIEMLAEVTRNQGEARGVTVETRLPKGGLTANGLEGRIAQVITNLLDNALSFSPDGARIVVEAGRRPSGGVRLTVTDEGPGIPPDNIASIFERFYTERPDPASFGSHSGLGLSISRQIVEAHGGRIWAENMGAQAAGTVPGSLSGTAAAARPDPADPEARGGARFVVELPG